MRLGKIIADYRYMNRLGIREVAKQIGMSPATLCRIENGKPCDSDNMAKLMLWLFASKEQKE
jgi:transcriptional regulator with XRE-family HTH domain